MAERLRWLARAWKYRLKIDPGEIRFLLRFLSPGDLAVDIGAHKGAYTWWLSKAVGGQGHVIAFEPNPRLAAKLCSLARTKPNISVENLGVSSRSETRTLVIPARSAQEASYELPNEPSAQTIATRTVSLDRYFKDWDRPVKLMKCDVEGHELSVFRGAQHILTRDRPAILFECEERHLKQNSIVDVFDHLQGRGYQGYFFRGRQYLAISELAEHMTKRGNKLYIYNYLFLPRI